MKKAQTTNSKLHVLFEGGKLFQERSSHPCLQIPDQQDIPLRSLLRGSGQAWKLREKSILAVVLAHAVLHCSEGPWLRADWSKEHVSFFKKDGTQQVDLSRPFLTVDFREQTATNDNETDFFMPHSNPALLSLGILLLEITKGEGIETHWLRDDLIDGVHPNDNTNLTTALRLLESSDGDLVVGYRKAVKACLDWETVNGDQENENLTKRMYETIVEPLERELEHGFGLLPEHLGLAGIMERRSSTQDESL